MIFKSAIYKLKAVAEFFTLHKDKIVFAQFFIFEKVTIYNILESAQTRSDIDFIVFLRYNETVILGASF